MAVSCGEVMYGAYYPYLYGRGAARLHHHHHHFQYDRFNVGAGTGGEGYGGGGAVSSGSSQSPGSPPHAPPAPRAPLPPPLRAKEEDLSTHGRTSADGGGSSESDGECAAAAGAGRARAQYVSANCVVFTHYSGDVAAVVDEHFARALSVDKAKESVPMVSRNLPASFFNALAGGGAGACGGVELYEYDPWHQHYGSYAGHVGHVGHVGHSQYAHNMAAAGYGPLLLGRGSLHAQYKPVEWGAQHHLDPAACAPYSYPTVPGLEAQVQDSSKDLYWF